MLPLVNMASSAACTRTVALASVRRLAVAPAAASVARARRCMGGMPGGEEDSLLTGALAGKRSGTRPAAPVAPERPADVVSRIVESVAADVKDSTRVLAVLCDNEAGVLSRVAGTLSARGFNIESLTVNSTNVADLSRMTIVMRDVPETKATQALKQLSDIVNVWAVVDYTGTNSLTRELVMVKVSYLPNDGGVTGAGVGGATLGGAPGYGAPTRPRPPTYAALIDAQPHRAAVRDIGALFGSEVVDVGSRHITFQLTSWPRRIDAFIRMMEPWGIIEVARSGVVAMLRSPVTGAQLDPIKAPQDAAPDASALPPG